MPQTSLTPVILNLSIENGKGIKILDTSASDSPIGLNGMRWTHTVNSIAEASVSLTYRNLAGLDLLKQLFPTTIGNPTFYSTATVKIMGFKTSFSTIQNDIVLFKGYIVGYGQENRVGQTTFSLNLRGPMSRLQQIPLACPGFHISNGISLGIMPYISTESSQTTTEARLTQTVSILANAAGRSKNGYELFNNLISSYKSILENAFSVSNDPRNVSEGIMLAIKAFGFISGNPNSSIIDKELANISVLGNISLNHDIDGQLRYVLGTQSLASFFNSPQLTFWDLFLYCTQLFTNNLITLGDKYYVYVSDPLDDPSQFNTINRVAQTDMINYEVSDFPFYTPTRCYLASTAKSYTNSSENSPKFGVYPANNELLPLEKEIGVYLLYREAPVTLREYRLTTEKSTDMSKISVSNSGKDIVKQQIDTIDSKEIETTKENKLMFDDYAKYVLILEKLRQRNASVATRFLPTIIPGLPISVEDPLGVAPFDGYVQAVNHNIDCTTNTALTQIMINHVRYKGELDEYPMKNPIYPDAKLSDIEPVILKQLNI